MIDWECFNKLNFQILCRHNASERRKDAAIGDGPDSQLNLRPPQPALNAERRSSPIKCARLADITRARKW
jgi:hypothetical protein